MPGVACDTLLPIAHTLLTTTCQADAGTLGHSLHHTRSELSTRRDKLKLEVLKATMHPSHMVVHDERTFAQRTKEVQMPPPLAHPQSQLQPQP